MMSCLMFEKGRGENSSGLGNFIVHLPNNTIKIENHSALEFLVSPYVL
jgi:hypothetical protein